MLTLFYGLSTILIFLFGSETYFVPGQNAQRNSRLLSLFGIHTHNLSAIPTLWCWSKILIVYVLKLPLLLCGIATMVSFCWPIGTHHLPVNLKEKCQRSDYGRNHGYRFDVRRAASIPV